MMSNEKLQVKQNSIIIEMQQYYQTDTHTISAFHTSDNISFNIEFCGGFSLSRDELYEFLSGDSQSYTATVNPAEEYKRDWPTLDNKDYETARLSKNEDGLVITILDTPVSGGVTEGDTTVKLSGNQVETLMQSLQEGVEIDNGKYEVEFIGSDGKRE